jgi:hypothetical protein
MPDDVNVEDFAPSSARLAVLSQLNVRSIFRRKLTFATMD